VDVSLWCHPGAVASSSDSAAGRGGSVPRVVVAVRADMQKAGHAPCLSITLSNCGRLNLSELAQRERCSVDAAHAVDRDFLDQQFVVFIEKIKVSNVLLDERTLKSDGRHGNLLGLLALQRLPLQVVEANVVVGNPC
jgi:hypothetical protein